MKTYSNKNQIRLSLQQLVAQYVEECEACEELSEEFISLIKHNFLAKYVVYNKEEKQIEIGIDKTDSHQAYPEIEVYKIPVKKAAKWLDKSFKDQRNDLEFYGKLLNKNEIFNSSDFILMSR